MTGAVLCIVLQPRRDQDTSNLCRGPFNKEKVVFWGAVCNKNKMALGNTEVEKGFIGTKDCEACRQVSFPCRVQSLVCKRARAYVQCTCVFIPVHSRAIISI